MPLGLPIAIVVKQPMLHVRPEFIPRIAAKTAEESDADAHGSALAGAWLPGIRQPRLDHGF